MPLRARNELSILRRTAFPRHHTTGMASPLRSGVFWRGCCSRAENHKRDVGSACRTNRFGWANGSRCAAETLGLSLTTIPHGLIAMADGNLAYITRRVDRRRSTPYAIPMEDLCQLSGRLTEDKYRGSYEKVGDCHDPISSRLERRSASIQKRLNALSTRSLTVTRSSRTRSPVRSLRRQRRTVSPRSWTNGLQGCKRNCGQERAAVCSRR